MGAGLLGTHWQCSGDDFGNVMPIHTIKTQNRREVFSSDNRQDRERQREQFWMSTQYTQFLSDEMWVGPIKRRIISLRVLQTVGSILPSQYFR